jgi:hypothetical protein
VVEQAGLARLEPGQDPRPHSGAGECVRRDGGLLVHTEGDPNAFADPRIVNGAQAALAPSHLADEPI